MVVVCMQHETRNSKIFRAALAPLLPHGLYQIVYMYAPRPFNRHLVADGSGVPLLVAPATIPGAIK